MPADERTAKLLDGACVGTPAGGARSAADAAGAAAAVFGPEAVSASVSGERGGAGVCVRLSLEEAVFLVHVLGTLRLVVEQEGVEEDEKDAAATKKKPENPEEEPPDRVAREMGGEELWRYACLKAISKKSSRKDNAKEGERGGRNHNDDDDEAFLRSYAAFHHFRCKGWTVRSGLRYGCDYVLYQGHPASAHADVCVLAVSRGGEGGGGKVKEEAREEARGGGEKKKQQKPLSFFTARESPSRQAGPLTWLDVEIGNRLAAQVGKRLLLLHVQVSRGDGEEEGRGGGVTPPPRPLLSLTAAEALSRVTVEERLVERWVPDVDREEPVV